MRYVNIANIEEGMILAKPFYGSSGELMLNEGSAFSKRVLDKFDDLQYSGFYILDEISEDIEIQDIIPDELRSSAVRTVRSLMLNMKQNRTANVKDDIKLISSLANKIIAEIISSEHPIVNMIDPKASTLYIYQHSVNVCVMSCIIGTELGLIEDDLYKLAVAALLHDVGYAFIPDAILNKPGTLEPEEQEEIKKHSDLGYEYTKNNFFFDYTVNVAILQHHERYDGTGYPLGQKGEKIVLFSRIIAVADVFDAITYKRPYREAMRPSEAYEYILGNSGQHFHPEIVNIFIKKIAPFPLGVTARLSNGLEGIIFKNHPNFLMRPLIKIINPQEQSTDKRFLDLLNDPDSINVTIKELLA